MRQEIREDVLESDVGHFVEMITYVNLEENFSVTSPAKNYLAIYGGNAQNEGSSLMLYNIQYNLIEARQQFKVLFNKSRLWSLGSNIMLATGQSLSVIPFHVSDEQLWHLIGSKKNASDGDQSLQNDMIDEGNEDQMLIEFKQNMRPGTFNLEERERPLTNPEFEDMVETLLCTTDIQLVGCEDGGEVTQCRITINEDPEDELSLPLRTLVKAMESRGFSEMEITNEVIPELISHKAVSDLMRVLRKYSTISEGVLAGLIHFAVEHQNKELLARALTIEFEEEYMIGSLRRKLDIEDVLFVVQFLYECLSGSEPCPEIDDMDLCDVVLKWLMCLVDAHYTSILLSRSQRMTKQLLSWKELIEKHIEGLQQLSNFSAVVERMALAKSVSAPSRSKWYNIEVIRI